MIRQIVKFLGVKILNKFDKYDRLKDALDRKLKDVEDRLNKKLQRALDNPLANN